MRLTVVDGSTVSSPDSKGSDWRLHARYEPARGGFTDLAVTSAQTAEARKHVAMQSGDVLLSDRGDPERVLASAWAHTVMRASRSRDATLAG